MGHLNLFASQGRPARVLCLMWIGRSSKVRSGIALELEGCQQADAEQAQTFALDDSLSTIYNDMYDAINILYKIRGVIPRHILLYIYIYNNYI